MAKSYPTINQSSKNYSYWSSGRRDEDFGFGASQRARNGTEPRVIWQLPDNWQGYLLSKIFTQSQIRSMAIFVDPSRAFVTNISQVAPRARKRKKGTSGYRIGPNGMIRIITSSNYENGDQSIIVPEYVQSDTTGLLENPSIDYETFYEDSTQKLRPKGVHYSAQRSCKTDNVWENYTGGSLVFTEDDYVHTAYSTYPLAWVRTRVIYTFTVDPDNPIVAPIGNWGNTDGIETLDENVKSVCKDLLPDVLTPCLTSARKFNAFYQIGELKDLPMMIRKTSEFVQGLRSLAKDPKFHLLSLDKLSSDAYLNFQFGYKSLLSTAKSLCKLPEKLAKRFNYLLERNRKRTTQRFDQVYENILDMGSFKPVYGSLIDYMPGSDEREHEEVSATLTLKCVVTSEINFPPLAIPKFSDSKFRDLLGLNPRITDLYNLVPWTWLLDWFTGLSGYLNLVETLTLDDDLINYGFLTAQVDAVSKVKGNLSFRDRTTHWGDISQTIVLSNVLGVPKVIPYDSKSTIKFHSRINIADLEGVKSASNEQGLLSDYQVSIIGALISKFSGKT